MLKNSQDNRVLQRKGARELTPEEIRAISAGAHTFRITGVAPILDAIPD